MKIVQVKVWSEDMKLTRPYDIAYRTVDSVENVFVRIEAENGLWGIGAGSPAEYVTGESLEACKKALHEHAEETLIGMDIRALPENCRALRPVFGPTPAARTAVDVALHDILAKFMDVPLVKMLGAVHAGLPTSITVGIKSLQESLSEASEYVKMGFRIIKLKIGRNLEADIEVTRKLRETVGGEIGIRVDANQGYSAQQLGTYLTETASSGIELVEQPVPKDLPQQMLHVDSTGRARCAADESIQTPLDALRLSNEPQPFGIFNIKLMKCGGVAPALRIASIAELAGIELMWGCMDESIISISAALHAALASPATRYIDLDGSLDLAQDLVTGGFVLKDGFMSVTDRPGLGVELI